MKNSENLLNLYLLILGLLILAVVSWFKIKTLEKNYDFLIQNQMFTELYINGYIKSVDNK